MHTRRIHGQNGFLRKELLGELSCLFFRICCVTGEICVGFFVHLSVLYVVKGYFPTSIYSTRWLPLLYGFTEYGRYATWVRMRSRHSERRETASLQTFGTTTRIYLHELYLFHKLVWLKTGSWLQRWGTNNQRRSASFEFLSVWRIWLCSSQYIHN